MAVVSVALSIWLVSSKLQPGRDGIWHESGIVEKFVAPRIELRWLTRLFLNVLTRFI